MSDQNNKTDNDSQENTQQDERVIIPTTRLTADDKEETQEIPSILPVLPVRDVVIFNYMVLPLFITRERSVSAVEKALASLSARKKTRTSKIQGQTTSTRLGPL